MNAAAGRHQINPQKAMAYAMIYPEAGNGGRGKKSTDSVGFSRTRIRSGFLRVTPTSTTVGCPILPAS